MIYGDWRPDDRCIIKYYYYDLLQDDFHGKSISGANCSLSPFGDFVCFSDELDYMLVVLKVILNNDAKIFNAGFS